MWHGIARHGIASVQDRQKQQTRHRYLCGMELPGVYLCGMELPGMARRSCMARQRATSKTTGQTMQKCLKFGNPQKGFATFPRSWVDGPASAEQTGYARHCSMPPASKCSMFFFSLSVGAGSIFPIQRFVKLPHSKF